MKSDVAQLVKQCQVCQQAKHEQCKYLGLLQPLPIPQSCCQELSMNFIQGLPKSNGYSVIFVVVDRLTKYAHFIPIKHHFKAQHIAHLFFPSGEASWVPYIYSVRQRQSVYKHFWQELFKLFGTKLHLGSAYHPQTYGQTEHINQRLEIFLRCVVHNSPSQWSKWYRDSLQLGQGFLNFTKNLTNSCSQESDQTTWQIFSSKVFAFFFPTQSVSNPQNPKNH